MLQAPQLATVEVRSTSQPLAGSPSQLPKPAAQEAMMQLPPAHPAVACGGAGQGMAQPPQLLTSLLAFTSQPFPTMPSQLRNPCWHDAMEHEPRTHSGVALGVTQALPQP